MSRAVRAYRDYDPALIRAAVLRLLWQGELKKDLQRLKDWGPRGGRVRIPRHRAEHDHGRKISYARIFLP
jgi:hypothetical protein